MTSRDLILAVVVVVPSSPGSGSPPASRGKDAGAPAPAAGNAAAAPAAVAPARSRSRAEPTPTPSCAAPKPSGATATTGPSSAATTAPTAAAGTPPPSANASGHSRPVATGANGSGRAAEPDPLGQSRRTGSMPPSERTVVGRRSASLVATAGGRANLGSTRPRPSKARRTAPIAMKQPLAALDTAASR
jgi:hypothetical protein